MKSILCLVRSNAKALAGLVAAAAVVLVTRLPFHLPAGTEAAVTAAVAGFIVYLIPNTDCA